MKFIKSWKFMAIVLGVLFVAALVGVIYGVATHTEAGFVDASRSWDHVPVTVSCTPYIEHADGCQAVFSAVMAVNSRLGFEMLEPSPGDADIDFVVGAPVEVGDELCGAPGECFELRGRSSVTPGPGPVAVEGVYEQCDVRIMNTSGGDLEWLVSYHALGHCLGLAHDDFELSIMRPVQRPTPDGVLPPWITDFDRELLRGKYGDLR